MQTTNLILEQPLPFNGKHPDTVAQGGMIAEGRVVVTPEMARQILETCNYSGQRSVSKSHVAKLAVQMRNGAWAPGSQIAFGLLDHKVTLVNGQHRLNAVIEVGQPVEFQFLVVPVANGNALHALYYSFDAVQRGRSGEVVLRSTGIADQWEIAHRIARGAYAAGVIISLGFRNVAGTLRDPELGTPDGRLKAIAPWWPVVKQYDDIVSKSGDPVLRPKMADGGVMAVALVTLKHQPEKARAFWSLVAANDALKKGTPERTLVDSLMLRSFKGAAGATMLISIACWNAHFGGRTLQYVKPGAMKDIRIQGTPYGKASV